MLSYYLERGIQAEYLLSLDLESRLFYLASMQYRIEERRQMFKG